MLDKYINPNKKYIWISLAFIIKILLSIYLLHSITNPENTAQTFAILAGDTFSYFGTFDNLISKGGYDPFYRMPGVGFMYYLFRLLFSQQISYGFFILFQIFFDTLACYFLSKLAYQLLNSKTFFLIVFILSVTNSYFSVFNIWLLSESICTSALIFSIYYFYQAISYSKQKNKSFLLSGFFITWAIFCRPIYMPFLVIYIVIFVFCLYKNNKELLLKSLLIFCAPFIFFDAIWVYVGYQHSHKIYILQHSNYSLNEENNSKQEAYQMEKWKKALVQYIVAFGGDAVDWNPDAEITWFGTNTNKKLRKVQHLPMYAFTKNITKDSLLMIKENIQILHQTAIEQQIKDSIKNRIEETMVRYRSEYISQKPLQYHFFSRVIILKKLIFHQPTYNLYYKQYTQLNILEKTIKIFYFLLYYMYIFGFFISFVFIILNQKIYLFLPIILLVLFGVSIYPYLRLCEYRYIVPVMPFILLLCSYSIFSIINLLYYKKWKKYLV